MVTANLNLFHFYFSKYFFRFIKVLNYSKSENIFSFYSFLSREYIFKLKYFRFDINNVSTNTAKDNKDIKKIIFKEKYQSILKKLVIKIYESKKEKNNENKIMGTKIIKDSNSINLIIPNRS